MLSPDSDDGGFMTELTGADGNGGRRVDLDWVRILAFGLLIFYHVGMAYVPWNWHIKSAHQIAELEPVMRLVNPWRLALLFLVSGAATHFLAAKTQGADLFRSRTWRLLLPLAFGMLVIVPPQTYIEVVEKTGYSGSFFGFYRDHYLAFGTEFCRPGPCLIMPTWNHLWFVAYLWVYTMIACMLSPAALQRAADVLARWLTGPMLIIAPVLLLALYRIVLWPHFPSTHALVGDWYNHALFGTFFLFGLLFARTPGIWAAIDRYRWVSLVLGASSYALWIGLLGISVITTPWLGAVRGLLYALDQWGFTLAALGFAGRWLTRDSAIRRYLTDAIFPCYIIHQTAIIVIVVWLKPFGLSTGLEAIIVIVGTAIASIAAYEAVRRVAWLRPLFGLKRASGGAAPVR
jgi:hypothetical protein